MRNPLNKSLKKEFLDNRARYFSLAAVMIIMIGAVSGFLSVAYGCKTLLLQNQIDANVEDGQFTIVKRLTVQEKRELEKLDIQVVDQFYSEQTIGDDTTLRVFPERTKVNLPTISEGRLPEHANEIALDRLFAVKNDYIVGHTIMINDKQMKITGLLSVPDYTSLIENTTDVMMDPIHFGVSIVNQKTFATLDKAKVHYQYVYTLNQQHMTDKEKYEVAEALKNALLEKGVFIESLMSAQMNQAISFLPNDMGSDIPMIQTLLYIILVILAFIFVVISTSIIEEQSTVIGTLLASGYTKQELIHHYMILPVCIIIFSSLIGNVVGYTIFPSLFANMYYNSYCLPPLQIGFVPEAFMSTTIIPLLFMAAIQFLMLYRRLRTSPLRFLRKDLHRQHHQRYIHLKNQSFFQRYRLRVILQNKGSYLTLFCGIIFASFLFLFGLIMTPSMEHYIAEANSSVKAEYQYILKTPIEADGEKTTFTSLKAYYKQGDINLDVTFYGLHDNSQYFNDVTMPIDKDHIVISSDFASKMNLRVHDTITFMHPYTEHKISFIVQDIYDYQAGFSAFMTQQQLNQILGKQAAYFNGYLSDHKLSIDEIYIDQLISRNDVIKIGEQMTQTFSQMIPILTSVSIIIYLIVMYILTKLVIDRNVKVMSFLQILGYQDHEIKRLYLHATAIVVCISLCISLPLSGIGLHYLMQFAFMQFASYIVAYIPPYAYALVFFTGLLSYCLISWRLTKQISNLDLGTALKDEE